MSSATSKALAWVGLTYLLGLGAAAAVVVSGSGRSALTLLVADLVATLVVFVGSRLANNSSFYDPYWSVAPPVLAGWLAYEMPGDRIRQTAIVALVSVWGARLTFNWIRGWTGLGHEDWRYVELRSKTKGLYWLVSLFGLHLMPTLVVFVGCLSLWPAMSSNVAFGPLDGLAAATMLLAVYFEARADRELHRFRKQRTSPGEILETGLWRYSRHPNYFGEILLWVGLCLFALAARGAGAGWTALGPAVMVALFVFISIPMIEKRMAGKPGYADRQARVSALVPLPPRRPAGSEQS